MCGICTVCFCVCVWENMSACAWMCAFVWMRITLRGASACWGIIQMLPPCLLLSQLSPHRRDQTRTMPVWQLPFSVPEPCGKGRPSAAELMMALLNSRNIKPCTSAVQSPAASPCVSVSKPSIDLGVNHKGMSFLPNHLTLDEQKSWCEVSG